MLSRLKTFLQAPAEQPIGPDDTHLAAAVLLAYAAMVDGEFDANEADLLHRVGGSYFGLNDEEVDDLFDHAQAAAEASTDLYHWTSKINAQFSEEHKLQLMELLWRVVDADGTVTDYEASLLRRIAGLIYVSDKESALARQRARETSDND